MTKTRQMLFEPFDLTKWAKLAIILFFIGSGCGGYNFSSNPSGSNFGDFSDSQSDVILDESDVQLDGSDVKTDESDVKPDAFVEEAVSGVSTFVDQYLTYIVLAVLAIVLVIVLFSYISYVMQFVFVESVVRDQVTIRAYVRNNLMNGLRLFILNWTLGIVFLIAIILSLLPALSAIRDGNFSALFFGSLIWFFLVFVLGIIILAILSSFINLAIPVMLYENVGVLKALSKVISTAVHSIPQVLVYWIIRGVLGIILSIAAAIISLIVFLIAGLILLLIGIAVYLILTCLGFGFPDMTVLIVLGLFFVAAILGILFISLLTTVPFPVFMRYHTLLFLQNWYADIVPFQEPVPEPA